MSRAFKGLLRAWAVGAGALVLLSFAGVLHPFGDSLAVLRWQLAALCGVLALVGWGRQRPGLALMVVSLAVLMSVGWAWLRPQADRKDGDILVYQKNLSFSLPDIAPLVADIRAVAPDVVMVQEIADGNAALMQQIAGILPYQIVCPFHRIGAVGLATRLPPIAGADPICLPDDGVAGLMVMGPDGPLWLLSAHFYWPWPRGQMDQVTRLGPVLTGLDAPVIVAGDFNMVPGGASLRLLRGQTGTTRLGRVKNSFAALGPLFPLPIDHIFVPEGSEGGTELRGKFLSDHGGLLGWVRLPSGG